MKETFTFTTYSTAFVLAVSLLLAGTVAMAKGPANKATGGVTWTARTHLSVDKQIPGIVSEFNAHDLGPGMNDKGTHSIYIPENTQTGTGSRVVEVVCARVDADEAWFAGEIVDADGDFVGQVGSIHLTHVADGSTSGAEADKIGGRSYATIEQACGIVDAGGWSGTGDVTAGNLVVHYKD